MIPMCTMSMVHDHYRDEFNKWPGWTTGGGIFNQIEKALIAAKDEEIAALKKTIEDYKTAMAAATVVDVLTKQPDCIDPEKAKLKEHVARLERVIDALTAPTPPPSEG